MVLCILAAISPAIILRLLRLAKRPRPHRPKRPRPLRQQLRALPFDSSVDTAGTMPFDYETHRDRIVCVHKDPLVLMIDNFLPNEMCDEIIARAATDLRRSPTKQKHRGAAGVFTNKRRSQATWFNPGELAGVNARMQNISPRFAQHIGAQRVIRYKAGDYFARHKDSFTIKPCYQGNKCVVSSCDQRIGILFCYLNTCESGGETYFTDLELPPLKPAKGRAFIHFPVYFPSLDIDPRVYHEGRTAVDTKWLLTSWWSSIPRDYIATTPAALHMHEELKQTGDRPRDASKLPFKGVGAVM